MPGIKERHDMARAAEDIKRTIEQGDYRNPHDRHGAHRKPPSWSQRMSGQAAWALLVYTGLQIFVVMGMIKTEGMSLLPYFGLIFLVGLIIPACRYFERRWKKLSRSEMSEASLKSLFVRDVAMLWALAFCLPVVCVLLFKGLALIFS